MRSDESLSIYGYQTPLGAVASDDADTLDIAAVITFVRRSWRLCLLWLAAALCSGVVFLSVAPRYYTASSILVFQNNGASATLESSGAADAATSTYVETQIQVLQSEEVLGRVIEQQQLVHDSEFGSGQRTVGLTDRHATILRVTKALAVRRIGTSEAVQVTFKAKDSGRSAEIANAVVRAYMEAGVDQKRRDRAELAAEMHERLAEIRSKAFPNETTSGPASVPLSSTEARNQFRQQQDNREAYRAAYNGLLQRANTAADGGLPQHTARVITPAEPPLAPTSPQPLLVLGVVLAGGIVTGVAHALLREVTDRGLRRLDDVQRLTGLDCVVGIPKVEAHEWVAGAVSADGLQRAYVTASSEVCRTMARLAIKIRDADRRPSIIGIVGATEGAGASSIAAHLANILAEAGLHTLLVDANWLKNGIEPSTQNTAPSRMLTNRLTAIHLEASRLDVLVLRATAPISPLNASISIRSALAHAQPEYDCIIVDLNAIDHATDLEAVLGVIDRAVLVVGAGTTTVDDLSSVLRILPRDRIEMVILNKITADIADLRTECAQLVAPLVQSSRPLWHFLSLAFAAARRASLADWRDGVRTRFQWLRSLAQRHPRWLRRNSAPAE